MGLLSRVTLLADRQQEQAPDPVGLTVMPYDRDDDLLEKTRTDGIPRVRVYVPRRVSVVLGRGSREEAELNLNAVIDDGVTVERRRGGGCAVVLDPGNVVVAGSVVAGRSLNVRRDFANATRWLIEGLERSAIFGVERKDTSDLAVGDRKIAGACMYRSGNLVLYSATLLVEPDLDRMERYLKHPPREPDYRRGRAHGEFVIGLGTVSPGLSADELATRLSRNLVADRLAAAVGKGRNDEYSTRIEIAQGC
jgi:lipoate-protein ligase A